MSQTKELVVKLSYEACSIIIIGVGTADFSAMDCLDGDDELLRDDNGNTCARDIVQFVEFQEASARGDLAEEVLKEVPDQVCLHMERIGFKPVKLE